MPLEAETLEAPVEVAETVAPPPPQPRADFIKDTNARLDAHFAEKPDEPLVTPVVAPTVAEPAVEETVEEEAAAGPEWANADVLALAAEYGLEADDLDAFATERQFRAVMTANDKQNRAYGATLRQQAAPQPNIAGERTPPATPPAAPPVTAAPAKGYDDALAKLKESYGSDEPVVAVVEQLVADLKATREEAARANQQHQQQEHASQQAVRNADLNQLGTFILAMGMTEMFGESFDKPMTPAQVANWTALVDAYDELSLGAEARTGKRLTASELTAKRVVASAFPDQIKKQAKQEMARTVRKQSATRLGGGTRATPTGTYNGPVENDPVLHEAFKSLSKDPSARLTAR